MTNPPAILFATVDERSCDAVASIERLPGVAFYDDDLETTLITSHYVQQGDAYTAYCSGRFRVLKQNATDAFFVGDRLSYQTYGYVGGNGALYVYKDSSSGDRYAFAELNPAQSLVDTGTARKEEVFTVNNHGLVSILDFVPICLDLESGSATENQYVIGNKPLTGGGQLNDPQLRNVVFFATGIVDANMLRGWHVSHTTSLGEQTSASASYTPDTIGWFQDDGSIGPNLGTHAVRLCRYNTTTTFDYFYAVIVEGSAAVQQAGGGGGGYRWRSAEYDISQAIPSGTQINLNANTTSYTTLRDPGSAYLSHSTANAYQSDWKVIIDGQDLKQGEFTVVDGDTIQLSVPVANVTSDSEMVVWTQVAEP